MADEWELAEGQMTGTMSSDLISTKQSEIAALAGIEPKRVLTTLAHRIDLEWMREAYRRTRKDGAVGVDAVGRKAFEESLDDNLTGLLGGLKSGLYRAPPVRRVHIEKDGGTSTRPIGIPTLGDKVLQRAVVMALEPLYEQDFLDCSYGFRPGRSAHDALERLRQGTMNLGGGWIIDLDIRGFFENVDRTRLGEMLDGRVRDGVIRRAIGKWLNAGVMEEGVVSRPEKGTQQGGVASPLISNIYLHEVLDTWFEKDVRPRLRQDAFMVRYADDAVLCFADEDDARRVMAVLPKRLERFGLELNGQKTRLVPFTPPESDADRRSGDRAFDFLGFTHFWRRSRTGRWIVSKKTSKVRFGRSLKSVSEWCRMHRHGSLADQQKMLNRKLVGHYAYFGVIGNSLALARFRYEVGRRWRYWLDRRSNRSGVTWDRFARLLARYPLAPSRVSHSWSAPPVANP